MRVHISSRPSTASRFARAIVAAIVAFLALSDSASAQVKVLRAKDELQTVQSTSLIQTLVFDIQVQNLAYTKQVYIHMQDPCGSSSWVDVPASYVESYDGGSYELWRAGTTIQSTSGVGPFPFDAKYVVNGNTYWDNDGGQNYSLPFITDSDAGMESGVYGLLLGTDTNVILESAAISNGTFSGLIDLKNLSYQKTVNVRYTTDNWSTYSTLAANYAVGPNATGVEVWSFSASLGSATSVQFAISYTVNGTTYWDNNFGNNYTATASGANGPGTPVPSSYPPYGTLYTCQ